MFTAEERDRVRARLLELAEVDPGVVGAAITGAYAVEGGDEWSDIDLSFGIGGEVAPGLAQWRGVVHQQRPRQCPGARVVAARLPGAIREGRRSTASGGDRPGSSHTRPFAGRLRAQPGARRRNARI